MGRPRIDWDDPRSFTQPLQFFFYVCMLVALLAFFSGAIGSGVLLLLASAGLHVARSSIEEVAARRAARRERGERKRQVRLRSHRAARQAREAGAAKTAARSLAEPAAAEPIRVGAAPGLSARRESAAAGRRRQRVV
jgi:hypothetical protein